MKNLEEMSYDEMVVAARSMFGFEADELKTQFPTEIQLREFLTDARKGRGFVKNLGDEDKLGWDATDKTGLDDEAKAVVKGMRKKKQAKLAESIKKVGKVTEAEVAAEMTNIKKLLSEI